VELSSNQKAVARQLRISDKQFSVHTKRSRATSIYYAGDDPNKPAPRFDSHPETFAERWPRASAALSKRDESEGDGESGRR